MNRITKFVVLDILKNRTVIAYTLLLAVLSWSVFGLEDNTTKGTLTMLNIILLTVPLVSIIFSTIYLYNSSEFIELLLSQPVQRKKIWFSLFAGLCLSLVPAFMVGAGIPILINAAGATGFMMLAVGCIITMVFIALACLSAIMARDKAKGIGISIMLWLFFALLFDGLLLFFLFQFADYPIEKPMIAFTSLNPIDLSRILVLLHLDVSAMMGYTGAIFKDFFGTGPGLLMAFALLMLWILVPYLISQRRFRKKDL
ncbi:MAG: ABC transporter permease subunit [Ferruginibacter sp.]